MLENINNHRPDYKYFKDQKIYQPEELLFKLPKFSFFGYHFFIPTDDTRIGCLDLFFKCLNEGIGLEESKMLMIKDYAINRKLDIDYHLTKYTIDRFISLFIFDADIIDKVNDVYKKYLRDKKINDITKD